MALAGQMVSAVTHEVATPLSVVANIAEMLLLDIEPGSRTSVELNKIVAQTRRVAEMMRSLLNFVRQAPAQYTALDLTRLARETLDLMDYELRRRRIAWALEVALVVEDSGRGIAPEAMERLFDFFFQLDSAVEAMRRGAEDYLSKPLQLADARMSAERALERHSLRARVAQLETQARERYQFSRIIGKAPAMQRIFQIIGKAPAMQRIFQIIERVAPTNTTVLIAGRTGTGKELVARAIHVSFSRWLNDHLIAHRLYGLFFGSLNLFLIRSSVSFAGVPSPRPIDSIPRRIPSMASVRSIALEVRKRTNVLANIEHTHYITSQHLIHI
jgi:ActR/RegA family two-component response regulator